MGGYGCSLGTIMIQDKNNGYGNWYVYFYFENVDLEEKITLTINGEVFEPHERYDLETTELGNLFKEIEKKNEET